MRTLRFLLQKEFRQIFRDPSILRIIFAMPFIQLLVLPWAADYEVKNINLTVLDHDRSTYSTRLTDKVTSSGYFRLASFPSSYKAALDDIEKNRADIVLEIPSHFERDLVKEGEADVFLAVNSINGTKAILGSSYLQSIINDYNGEVRAKWIQMPRFNTETQISISNANWYNPLMNYQVFMVPGILVVLVTMVGSFLSALNIVREKEIGTIEQINVTPVKKHHFILAKLIPFWIIGLFILTIGLVISWLFYGIVPLGSLITLYIFSAVYLLAVLGIGLLISTISNTQQQAMLIAFFLMMTFILLGGLYTPIESMPGWAQWITKLNPVAYFIEVIRLVILKGSTLSDISTQLMTIGAFAVVLNGWAVLNYRKRT
jgi:ABC-2 type transport system permease protein